MTRLLHPLTDSLAAAGTWYPDPAMPLNTFLIRGMTEQHLQDAVDELLLLNGWRYHHETDSRRSNAGLPDTLAVRYDRVLLLELKSDRGRLSPFQLAWLGDFSAAGQEAALVGPGDLQALAAVVRRGTSLRIPPFDARSWHPEPLPSMQGVLAATRTAAHHRRGGRRARSAR